jgi:hypothetical protein
MPEHQNTFPNTAQAYNIHIPPATPTIPSTTHPTNLPIFTPSLFFVVAILGPNLAALTVPFVDPASTWIVCVVA